MLFIPPGGRRVSKSKLRIWFFGFCRLGLVGIVILLQEGDLIGVKIGDELTPKGAFSCYMMLHNTVDSGKT